jgi:hypothetical protein
MIMLGLGKDWNNWYTPATVVVILHGNIMP